MKIAIVGFDVEGRATYDYLTSIGERDITICDQKSDIKVPDGAKTKLSENYLKNLDRFDAVVRTPGLHPSKILAENPGIGASITSHINLFFGGTPTGNIIGVTGSKGKGTTSTLITKMLEADGKDVYLGGNIGTPPLTFVDKLNSDSWVVLELSNFQLIDLRYAPHYATCLMVVPEHLDWHVDMTEYVSAKQQLFKHQAHDDIAIYNAGNDWSQHIAGASPGQKIPYMKTPGADVINGEIVIENQKICDVGELKLLGAHNWQNVCAAITTVWQITQNIDAIRSVLTTFSGLEHRLELAGEIGGARYYDDSFGTTPETAIVAIKTFSQPEIIILGGSDKGANYDELAEVISKSNVKKVLLIGNQAPRIQQALIEAGFNDFIPGGTNMEEIVACAKSIASPGDVVLLSPACASFDMFKNYKERGDQFKAAVAGLKPASAER